MWLGLYGYRNCPTYPYYQCFGSRIRCFLTPESGIGKKSRSGSGWTYRIRFPRAKFFGFKYFNSSMRIWIWESFWPWIRDGKNSDSESGINIPDPQHCLRRHWFSGSVRDAVCVWQVWGRYSRERQLYQVSWRAAWVHQVPSYRTVYDTVYVENASASAQCWDPEPDVFGLPDPDPLVRGMDPAPDPDPSLFFLIKVLSWLK